MARKQDPHTGPVWDRRERVYDLFLNGHTTRDIARREGISHVTVQKDIRRFTEQVSLPTMDEYRRQSMGRLAIVTRALMAQINAGENVARNAEVIARIEERSATMLGADAAERVDVEVTHTVAPTILAAIERAQHRSTVLPHAQQYLPHSDHIVIDSDTV